MMPRNKKSVFAAVSLSVFVVPGAGQIYNRQYAKGIVLLLAYGAMLYAALKPVFVFYSGYLQALGDLSAVSQPTVSYSATALILLTLTWLYAVVDAAVVAWKNSRPAIALPDGPAFPQS